MSKFKAFLVLLLVAALALGGLAAFRSGGVPEILIEPAMEAIGRATPFRVIVSEPGRGLSTVKVELVQGDSTREVLAREYEPREPWEFWGARTTEDVFEFEVGRDTAEWLSEGKATVRVTAGRAPALVLRPGPEVSEVELPVKLRPPSLQVTSAPNYLDQGGSGVVTYIAGADAVRSGVRSGETFFPGSPLPGGGEGERFALYGARYDDESGADIRLIAEDAVGNVAESRFVDHYNPKPLHRDEIRVTDSFMERIVPSILAQSPELQDQGDLLANYLKMNNDLRKMNYATIAEAGDSSADAFLWKGTFLPMRNAQRMSRFAERRTYLYDGRAVDTQDHVGFDLASVRRAEIQAANAGEVVLARYLGIFGNTVIVDHGYGLQTLYSHLSQIDVAPGDRVERGQTLGRSGQTGMAGGDHLHFGVYLRGMPVNPAEWYDANWIRTRLGPALESALPR